MNSVELVGNVILHAQGTFENRTHFRIIFRHFNYLSKLKFDLISELKLTTKKFKFRNFVRVN